MAKADARREAVLAGDDQHRASLAAHDAEQTRIRADRIDPDRGVARRTDEAPAREAPASRRPTPMRRPVPTRGEPSTPLIVTPPTRRDVEEPDA